MSCVRSFQQQYNRPVTLQESLQLFQHFNTLTLTRWGVNLGQLQARQ